jgi:hypothetical protein
VATLGGGEKPQRTGDEVDGGDAGRRRGGGEMPQAGKFRCGGGRADKAWKMARAVSCKLVSVTQSVILTGLDRLDPVGSPSETHLR